MQRAVAEARLSKQFEVRGHQLQQMEEKAARRAAERAAGPQGVANRGSNEEEEERFLEMAAMALAQAEAEGTPTYPLCRAVHAALHPAPLLAAMIKPKKKDKAAEGLAPAAFKKGGGAKAAKAPSAG